MSTMWQWYSCEAFAPLTCTLTGSGLLVGWAGKPVQTMQNRCTAAY
jgi:hypothetical protein